MPKLVFHIASDWEEVVKLRNEIAKLKQELKSMDSTQSPAAFKALNTQLAASTQRMDELVANAAKAGAVMEGDFKKKIFDASQTVNGFTEKIIAQKAVVKDVEADVKRLGDAYRTALKRNPMSANGKLEEYKAAKKALDEEKATLFGLTQQQAEARLSVKKLRDEYALYNQDGKKVAETNNGIALSWKKALAVIGGVAALKKLGSEIIRVRGEFQSMQTAIETMVGKNTAGKIMPQIKELAKISPLTMTDMVGAEKMMLGFNIQAEDTIKYLKALSDISMGESSKFNSLTLAFSQMSAAGKLMGQDLNQMINAGFNPLQQIAERTGKSIATLKDEMSKGAISAEMVQQAFLDATSAGGKFYNMSENASKTINGQISMMQDALDAVFNELGTKGEGVIMSGIQITTSLIQNYETIGKVLLGLITTYGIYKAGLLVALAVEQGTTKAIWAKISATKAATVAQAAFNKVAKANPYVLLASLAIGAATAMYMFSKRATEAQEVQRRYNASKEVAIRKEEEHRQEIQRLINVASDEAEATANRNGAIEALKKAYPGIIEKYIDEEGHLTNLIQLQKELNEEQSKRKVEDNQTKLASINDKVRNQEEYVSRMSGSKEAINEANNVLKELQRQQKEAQSAVNADYINARLEEAKKLSDDELRKSISQWKSTFSKVTGDMIGDFSRDEVASFIKSLETLQSAREKQIKNKSYWEKRKKEASAALESIASSQKELMDAGKFEGIDASIVKNYKDNVKKLKEAEKELKVYDSSSKQEKESEKLRKQQEKYNILLDKQALEQKRSVEDLQMKVDESRIKAMDEGSAKTIAEMELNFEKEMQAVDRQKEDALRKKIDDARAAWEANPQNKGKSFDTTGIELSNDERKYYDELYKAVIAKNEKAYSNLANQYLSYTDQRLSIEKKFNDDIAVLQEARKKAEAKGDTDEISKIDRLIAKATADKGKELMKHDFDVLKQLPEYIRAFEDLKNTSSETLKSLLQQLEDAKSAAPTVLNPEDLREYTTTIQEIMDELDSRNPFQALADRQKELVEAEQELAKAKKQLDAVNNGAKIVTGVKSTSLGADGKIKIENIYLSATEALRKYNAAKDKAQKANNNFVKAERTAREKVDELADAIKGIGDTIGGQTGEIISLMGDVALFATGTIDGISKVVQTGANAISAVEKASVILGIISTAIQLLQKISELGSNKAFKQYEAYAEKLKEINALTDAVNQYRIAALEAQQAESNWFSTDNLKNLRDYKKLHDEVYKSYVDKAGESQAIYKNESGGGWLTGAFNWVMGNLSALSWWDKWKNIWGQGDYSKGQTAAINNLRIETRKKSKGFLGTGIGGKSQKTEDLVTWAKNQGLGDLFDDEGLINKELAQSLIDNYGNKLVGQTRETLESLIKLREQYDEYIEQLHEYVNSLYEPLVDNLVDSLWDWLDNGKDALDSFKDYASDTFRDIVSDMMRTIVLDKVVGSFSDDIAALYEEYAKGAINEAELMKKVAERTDGLVDKYAQNIPTLQNIMEQVNGYLQDAGIDLNQSNSISREASQKGIATASQDSVDENNGRLAVMQEHTYSINENVNRMATGIDAIVTHTVNLSCLTNINKTMQSILSMRDASLTHLSNIDSHTARLEAIEASLVSVKNGIDTLNTKGITLKR